MVWTAAGLLQAWESSAGLSPPARTAALLCAEGRIPDADAALDLDVGTAARLAGESLIESFGPTADLVVRCPTCAEVLQAEIDVPRTGPGRDVEGRDVEGRDVDERGVVAIDGWLVRAPTLRELASVRGAPDAAAQLRTWCVTRDRPSGGTAPDPLASEASDTSKLGDAPNPSDQELDEAMATVAGMGLLDGEVTCPGCGTAFTAELDLGVLLWDQVRSQAPRILADVAVLARAYGWSEQSILALPDARRASYLALAGGA